MKICWSNREIVGKPCHVKKQFRWRRCSRRWSETVQQVLKLFFLFFQPIFLWNRFLDFPLSTLFLCGICYLHLVQELLLRNLFYYKKLSWLQHTEYAYIYNNGYTKLSDFSFSLYSLTQKIAYYELNMIRTLYSYILKLKRTV